MRSRLSVLTILWIASGLGAFPILYLLILFANDNPTPLTKTLSGYLVTFYLQLIVQSFIAAASLKYIRLLRRYLFALLIILLSPILLVIGLFAGAALPSSPIPLTSFFAMLALQLGGSVWMWVLIGTKEKQAVPVEAPKSKAHIAMPPESRRKVARTFLYAPVVIFLLMLGTVIIASAITSIPPSLLTRQPSAFQLVLVGSSLLFGLSLLPSLAAGIYLMKQKRSNLKHRP